MAFFSGGKHKADKLLRSRPGLQDFVQTVIYLWDSIPGFGGVCGTGGGGRGRAGIAFYSPSARCPFFGWGRGGSRPLRRGWVHFVPPISYFPKLSSSFILCGGPKHFTRVDRLVANNFFFIEKLILKNDVA